MIKKPIKRSALRSTLGKLYYSFLRKLLWLKMKPLFSKQTTESKLPYCYFSHKTPLLRKLKDVDMWYQHNKIVNLKIAAQKLNGVIIRPGQVFSYWKLIGKPTKQKGYVCGMVLKNGTFTSGTGGGLCQMSNLIFWLAIHTPLTVIERHRHGYDVFPDSDRSQPFGSGATCFYPHLDLMIRNDTVEDFQLIIDVGEKHLFGELRTSAKPKYRYVVDERNHEMKAEYWGGFSRHNELYKQMHNLEGKLISEQLIVKNSAIMMYSPFLTNSTNIYN